MYYIGLDIGSTATKVIIRGDAEEKLLMPTGWSSKETLLCVKKN